MATFTGGRNRDDTFRGTAADDRFVFDPADLTRGDTIVGGDGAGTDVLVFTRGGTITADALANVRGVELIQLGDGGSSIALTTQLLQTARHTGLTVTGGAGDDRIDASGITGPTTLYPGGLVLTGGAGDDVLIGAKCYPQTIDGGAGRDTIVAGYGTVVYDTQDIAVSADNVYATLQVSRGMTIDLTRRDADQTAGDACLVTGFYRVDASRSAEGVRIAGVQFGQLTGGSGNDVLTGASVITGGGGRDTLVGALSSTTSFFVNEGDFVRGESITGHGGDRLQVTGSADFRLGTLTGLRFVDIDAGASAQTTVAFYASQLEGVEILTASGANARHALTVDIYMDSTRFAFGNNTIAPFVLHGTRVSDTIMTDYAHVFAGAGDDTIEARGDIHGEAGDDRVTTWLTPANQDGHRVVEGGAGHDTLVVTDTPEPYEVFVIDLSSTTDQTAKDGTVVTGFEDVDASQQFAARAGVRITGSAAANVLTGTGYQDVLRGGAGDDVLDGVASYGRSDRIDGGAGDDRIIAHGGGTLTGGAGADTFVWSGLFDAADTITDARLTGDTLVFGQDTYVLRDGAFDTVVVARDAETPIAGADLVIYTGGPLRSGAAVQDYLAHASPDDVPHGLFVAAADGKGHVDLYYVGNDTAPGAHLVVEFSGMEDALRLAAADFAFV